MSIKLMSAIFDAEFHDMKYVKNGEEKTAKASTLKLVLLAIADHANDQGESAYPGYSKLETKTALSRQGLADTIAALEYNGILTVGESPSKFGTNVYSINTRSLPAIAKDLPDLINITNDTSQATLLVKPLDYDQSSHLTTLVKPLDLNHPLTINKPLIKRNKEKISENLRNLDPSEYRTIPELALFIDATGWLPGSFVLELIVEKVREGLTGDAISAAFREWTSRGYKPSNVQGYLAWAKDGIPPTFSTVRKQPQPQPGGQYFKI